MFRFLFPLLLLSLPLFAFGQVENEKDTVLLVRLNEVEVKDIGKWKNDTLRYQFNQTRYYVQTILPYLTATTRLFGELNEKIMDEGIHGRDKRKYIASKEKELKREFEDKVKSLNTTQGVLLMKLIGRQTGANIYSMLNEFKNPLTAMKWLLWAKLNGFDLNKRYRPEDEELLEAVMFSLDYPLPDFYTSGATAVSK
jgi:hypothetical protein